MDEKMLKTVYEQCLRQHSTEVSSNQYQLQVATSVIDIQKVMHGCIPLQYSGKQQYSSTLLLVLKICLLSF